MNLTNLGVQEMSAKEVILINGGAEINEGQCVGGDLGGSTGAGCGGGGEEIGFWEALWYGIQEVAIAIFIAAP